jgi:hypothetical protein
MLCLDTRFEIPLPVCQSTIHPKPPNDNFEDRTNEPLMHASPSVTSRCQRVFNIRQALTPSPSIFLTIPDVDACPASTKVPWPHCSPPWLSWHHLHHSCTLALQCPMLAAHDQFYSLCPTLFLVHRARAPQPFSSPSTVLGETKHLHIHKWRDMCNTNDTTQQDTSSFPAVSIIKLLGEKFRSDDTIHTIIRKISSKTKLRAKLHSFHDHTIHVRGGIYRTLVFIFYIKWLFYPWPKYL